MLKIPLFATLVVIATLQSTASELVELDVVAVDRRGFLVSDLSREEFEVRDGGKPVTIETFMPVAARGVRDEERSVVLLMDDVGVQSSGTSPMQQIGRFLLAPMRALDDIAVVRLSRPRDEAYGDVESARERLEQYHGGAIAYSSVETPVTVLKTLGRIAGQLQSIDHRRKVVACLGVPSVCDVREPVASSTDEFRDAWVAAVASAAKANVSMYEVDPRGLGQVSSLSSIGLVRVTGGEILRNTNDFGEAAERIWRDASHYYLLGYWGVPPAAGQLRAVDVKTTRRGVEVRARRSR